MRLLRDNSATAPNAQGALVIDEAVDRKDGHNTAHVVRQYLGNVGKIENGVVSVSNLTRPEIIHYLMNTTRELAALLGVQLEELRQDEPDISGNNRVFQSLVRPFYLYYRCLELVL